MYRLKDEKIKPVGAMSETSQTLYFDCALLPEGWRANVRVTVKSGRIAAVLCDAPAQADDIRHWLGIPGIVNVHSHAFQRAMSGLAERRGPSDDDFWSWRETMYRFALAMSPDQVEAVAAQAYVEMLEAGFTSVGEFHYLHHAPDGRAYANVAEMSTRIAAAAQATQISLTLLPAFYAHSGFGGAPPSPEQRRFICDTDGFGDVVQGARRALSGLEGGALGLAPHSLRAVTPSELAMLVAMAPGEPIHLHIAEQSGEVAACLAWSGMRPVEWLLENQSVDARWLLIHATHMTAEETRGVAASGAGVGLCPITEANLGDGFFNAAEFLANGGRFGVGGDSNVEISLAGELRMLEYSQRLAGRRRNVVAAPAQSSGRALYEHAQKGGEAALGRAVSGFVIGASADVIAFDRDALNALGREKDALLDAWIFSGGAMIDRVYARGRLVVRGGAHIAREPIAARFRRAMRQLLDRGAAMLN